MAQPLPFAGANITVAPGKGTEDRVGPLVGHRSAGGEMISRWKLSPAEIAHVRETGEVWLSQMTFRHPLQPALVSGLPLMQLLDQNGAVAGVYEPDALLDADAQPKALAVFDTPDAV